MNHQSTRYADSRRFLVVSNTGLEGSAATVRMNRRATSYVTKTSDDPSLEVLNTIWNGDFATAEKKLKGMLRRKKTKNLG